MIRRILLAGLIPLSLSCASSGGTAISDDSMYPWGMLAFEGSDWYRGNDIGDYANVQQAREDRKFELLEAYYEFEADAFMEPRKRGGVREFSFIRFTDPDCRE